MGVELPLESMSFAEKLEAMELLWADISRSPNEMPVPNWHGDILRERQRRAEAGESKFLDWDTAIAELKEEIREDRDS